MAPPARIVVADDDAPLRGLVVQLLVEEFSRYRPTVSEAENGAEAIVVCTTQPVDVLIVAPELADVSGLHVIRAIADAGAHPCVITWSADPRMMAPAIDAGADYAVDKADGVGSLIEAIRKCLEQRAASSA
jgi:DNA-binding NarL/FixJ family response regulator